MQGLPPDRPVQGLSLDRPVQGLPLDRPVQGLLLDQLVATIADRADRLVGQFERAGTAAPVPTCPPWTAADLIGHLGGVHRFAATVVAEARTTMAPDDEVAALFRTPDAAADPDPAVAGAALVSWFRAGAERLVAVLAEAPADLDAILFLPSADPPRHYWARRQAHETTVHGVDMLAARLGRRPTTGEADVPADLAVDGIDEVLRSFLTRPGTELRRRRPYRMGIRATDADAAWTVTVSADVPEITAGVEAPDAELSGSAAALYLRLWGRGADPADPADPAGSGDTDTVGPEDVLAHWAEHLRI